METTPRRVTGSIRRFLENLKTTTSPLLLPFTEISADYRAGYCLNNCEAESRRSGRPIVFGWIIWESRAEELIEAEFHAVIRRGMELLDITPRRDGENLVLFAKDTARSAVRVDPRTWKSWRNHKAQGGMIVDPTQPTEIEDVNASVQV